MKKQVNLAKRFSSVALVIGFLLISGQLFFAPRLSASAENVRGNLLTNGDFETGDLTGWFNAGGDDSVSAIRNGGTARYEGYVGQSTRENTQGDNQWGFFTGAAVTPGSAYKFSIDIKTKNTRGLWIRIDWHKEGGTTVKETSVYGYEVAAADAFDWEWKSYIETVEAPEDAVGCTIYVRYQNPRDGGTATMWIDNAVFAPASEEFVYGDFETGALTGWRNDGGDNSVAVEAYAGNDAERFGNFVGKSTRTNSENGANAWGISTAAAVTAGKRYTFSVDVKTVNTLNIQIHVYWFNEAGGDIGSGDLLYLDEPGGSFDREWKNCSGDAVAPEGAVSCRFMVRYRTENGGISTMWLDNAKLESEKIGYSIGVPNDGTVSVNVGSAKSGDVVSVTVNPPSGKQLKGGMLWYTVEGHSGQRPLYKRAGSLVYEARSDGNNHEDDTGVFFFGMPDANVQIVAEYVDANYDDSADAVASASEILGVFGVSYRKAGDGFTNGIQFGARALKTITVGGVTYRLHSTGMFVMRNEIFDESARSKDGGETWGKWLKEVDPDKNRWRDVANQSLMDRCETHIDFAARLTDFDSKYADAKYAVAAYVNYVSSDGKTFIRIETGATKAVSYNEARLMG